MLEEAGRPPSHLVIVTCQLDDVSELIGTGKSLPLNETRAPLDAVSEGEVNDEALRLGGVRLNHLLDDVVDKVIAESRAVTHRVSDLVFKLSQPLICLVAFGRLGLLGRIFLDHLTVCINALS